MIRARVIVPIATVLMAFLPAACDEHETPEPERTMASSENTDNESTDGSAPTMEIGSVEYFQSIAAQLETKEYLELLPDELQNNGPYFTIHHNEITTQEQGEAGKLVYLCIVQNSDGVSADCEVTVVADESGFPTVVGLELL